MNLKTPLFNHGGLGLLSSPARCRQPVPQLLDTSSPLLSPQAVSPDIHFLNVMREKSILSSPAVLQELQALAKLANLVGNNASRSPQDLLATHGRFQIPALREEPSKQRNLAPSCRAEPFPERLRRLLLEVETVGRSDVISFLNDDTFRIHNPVTFFEEVVPQYFRQSKLTSFKRQLKLYGFELINHGPNKGGYRHKLFSKKNPDLCKEMKRIAIKGPKSKDEISELRKEERDATKSTTKDESL